MSNLISTKVAAEIIGVSEVAMCKWRAKGIGPSWTEQPKPGRRRPRFLYGRREVVTFARERDRLRLIEERMEVLEQAVVALAGRYAA